MGQVWTQVKYMQANCSIHSEMCTPLFVPATILWWRCVCVTIIANLEVRTATEKITMNVYPSIIKAYWDYGSKAIFSSIRPEDCRPSIFLLKHSCTFHSSTLRHCYMPLNHLFLSSVVFHFFYKRGYFFAVRSERPADMDSGVEWCLSHNRWKLPLIHAWLEALF